MPKVLKIDTVLGPATQLNGEDPLLLTSVDGQEGISVPYTYDLVLMRRHVDDESDRKVDVTKLLGSSARIGLLSTDKDDEGKRKYVHRLGCFSQFEKVGLSKRLRLLIFKARLIPAVMYWGGGVTFRVFEKMNVVDIIKEVLEGIRAHSSDVRFDLSGLRHEEFPRLAYCVQFRESSFGFLCRLMMQHGISYFFDREWGQDDDDPNKAPGLRPAENDTLVLVGPRDSLALRSSGTLNAKNVDIQGGEGIDDPDTIAAFTRSYRTSERDVSIGNYNPISPTKPLHAEKTIARAYDIIFQREGPPRESVLRREEFPAPADKDPDAMDVKNKNPNDPAADENRFVKDYAEEAIRLEELDVFKVSGMVKNSNFVAGRTFQIDKDETLGHFDQREFMLTQVRINAYENSYMSSTLEDVGDFLEGIGAGILNAALFNIPQSLGSDKAVDATTAMVGGAWANYLQNEQAVALAKWLYPNSPMTHQMTELVVLPMLQGGLGQQWPTLLAGNISNTIKEIIKRNAGTFTIQFVAVPWDQGLFLRPQVCAPRPLASGPQLATVVGPKDSKKGDIYADHQLGRVRVRFPWHLKVPAGSGPSSSPGSDWTDPFDNDRSTAWVPVSQAWSGTRHGIQFMPRIGDQVLVEYIDGDPERPIISGRVYHADNQVSNLPFLYRSLDRQQITTKSLFEAQGQTDITLSGIETRSTPKPDKGQERYHLLRFDDKYNDEQLLLRSQGRLDVTAKCSHYDTTEGNRHVLVSGGKNADGKPVGGSAFTTVGGEYDEHIGKSRYEAVDADYQLTVKGDTQFALKGGWTTVVGGNLSLNAGTIVIEASQKLTLKVGGSTVVLNACGVYLDGAMIYNQCGGPADSAADAHMKDVADASKADPGEPAQLRTPMAGGCSGGGGGGGKRGEHTVPAQHGPPCTQDPDHMICMPLPELCTADGDER
jgi:type VI secretion system secreted protein VgrG